MGNKLTKYKVELLCDYPEWWRYNLFVMVVGLDESGNVVAFNNFSDRVYDAEYGSEGRGAPEGYNNEGRVAVESDPCDHVEIYVYVVANTFPASAAIKDSPPFEVVLRVSAAGKVLEEKPYEVNQWGGLTVVAHSVKA